MKKITTAIFLFAITFAHAQRHNTTINANIKGLKPGSWLYWRSMNGNNKIDSTLTRPGGFQIKLHIAEGEGNTYMLQIGKGYNENNIILFYLDKGTVTIQGNGPEFKEATLSGTGYIRDWNNYNAVIKNDPSRKGIDELYKKANEAYTKKDSIGLAALKLQLDFADSIKNGLTK